MSNILFINGQWQAGQGHKIQSLNPARNEVIWQGETATAEQVDQAVMAARQAFNSWALLTVEARIAIVEKFAEQLTENKEALAVTIAQETGKPLWETRTEVGAMIGKIAISVRAYNERTGTVENQCLAQKPLFVTSLTAWLQYLAHITSRVTCQMAILCQH